MKGIVYRLLVRSAPRADSHSGPIIIQIYWFGSSNAPVIGPGKASTRGDASLNSGCLRSNASSSVCASL